MKAMILAAGLGTRLGHLTRNIPKALVEVAGKPLIYHVIQKLKTNHFTQIIINVHHFAEQIITYVENNNGFGTEITFSVEEELLDTGGGVKKAAWFFANKNPFLVHNVDILSDIDLTHLYNQHLENESDVTLAVQKRDTTRFLLFDKNNQLSGREKPGNTELINPNLNIDMLRRWAFLGIHIISPAVLKDFPAEKKFSIINAYMDLSVHGTRINACPVDYDYWFDLGRSENMKQIQEWFKAHPGVALS